MEVTKGNQSMIVTTKDEVPGLILITDFIDEVSETTLLSLIDQQSWNTKLSRRTQHYGYEYNYSGRSVHKETAAPIPTEFLLPGLAEYLQPTQAIVNEYVGNQGIGPHIDHKLFGPVIASLSLGAPTSMLFNHEGKGVQVFLPRRSLLILSGAARSNWKHSIPANKSYKNEHGVAVKKDANYRRVSITYRTV